ncbi:MAG: efflux RND transporter permease subunit [Gammaproteobacteria bacterium]|nr:efflux RND transporter permease subunit [Gammaproteobacteria bacterium]
MSSSTGYLPPEPISRGWCARFAGYFLTSRLTLLLALVSVALGVVAFLVTPREEEPQITRTIVDVIIPFPGASVRDVERMVVNPAEQLLSQSPGLEHILSVADTGVAMVSLYFEIGVSKIDALVHTHNVISANIGSVPRELGVLEPVVRSRDNDDVAVFSLALYARDDSVDLSALERIAHSVELELKRVSGTREVETIGGSGRAITITLDPVRLRAHNVTPDELQNVIRSVNSSSAAGSLLQANREWRVQAGKFIRDSADLENLVVKVNDGQAVLLNQVASLREGLARPQQYVWFGEGGAAPLEYPALTITVSKQKGENVTEVVAGLMQRTEELRNTIIPSNVVARVVRNYGDVANDKIRLLMSKIVLVVLSVATLIFVALGRREAAIVLLVITLTLSLTFFVMWGLGFTLNRASLFAAIVSIGLLVDDAVVVIENIHRHHLQSPGRSILSLIPAAVDEIGAPTVLATFAVIAALMPMTFVSGVSGEYFRPVPVITCAGMLISLLVAFAVTPWLSSLWMKSGTNAEAQSHKQTLAAKLSPLFTRGFGPLLDDQYGGRNRTILAVLVGAAMALTLAAPILQWVPFKLQPPDNKSEMFVVIDMPSGSPLEHTAALARDMAAVIAAQPEVLDYQVYVGTHAPLGVTGLLRKYYLRNKPDQAQISVNLVGKSQRDQKSGQIIERVRGRLHELAQNYGADIRIYDPPSGIPMQAHIVAEVYGPRAEGRALVAQQLRQEFAGVAGLVDVDDSSITPGQRLHILTRQSKAMAAGIEVSAITQALVTALQGREITYLHDGSKYPAPVLLQLSAEEQGDLQAILGLSLRGGDGQLVPLSELLSVEILDEEQPILHKDLLPVHLVTADIDSRPSSAIWAMLAVADRLSHLRQYFTGPPSDHYREYAVNWDGEWKLTHDTLRDLGVAYLVGIFLIYLLIVAYFGSYTLPLIIMVPIPFTLIGQMLGHILLGTAFTVTSVVGLLVLAGLIVRNSIMLVDFICTRIDTGMDLKEAVVQSANIRAQPIILTSLTAMVAALFLLDDPVFNGLAVALIFGNLMSTVLTLVVIPTLYFACYKGARRPGQGTIAAN